MLSGATLWQMVGGLALSLVLVLPWPLFLFTLGYCLEAGGVGNRNSMTPLPRHCKLSSRILYALLLTRLIAGRTGVGRDGS